MGPEAKLHAGVYRPRLDRVVAARSFLVPAVLLACMAMASSGVAVAEPQPAPSAESGGYAAVVRPQPSPWHCPSAKIWQNRPGPSTAITIGDRTLHVPHSLPNSQVEASPTRNTAWFTFHVNNAGDLSFGAYEANRPFLWSYELVVEITSAPGRVDDKEALGCFQMRRILILL
jgi:hypothetical protein